MPRRRCAHQHQGERCEGNSRRVESSQMPSSTHRRLFAAHFGAVVVADAGIGSEEPGCGQRPARRLRPTAPRPVPRPGSDLPPGVGEADGAVPLVAPCRPRGRASSWASRCPTPALRRPAPHHQQPQLRCRDRLPGAHSTAWRLLPARELGCGSRRPCWRRLTEWAKAGVFDPLHLQVLDRLGEQGQLDWAWASVDSTSMRAKRGGPRGRKSRRSWHAWEQAPPGLRRWRAAPDRGGDRRQRHLHHHVPDRPGRRAADPHADGQRRTRPGKLAADKGYGSRANRGYLRRRGIKPRIARRQVESSIRLGRHRWKVERAPSWLSCFRRLQVRWDRGSERWFALCCWRARSPASGGSDTSRSSAYGSCEACRVCVKMRQSCH
jgi:hypothetical protein